MLKNISSSFQVYCAGHLHTELVKCVSASFSLSFNPTSRLKWHFSPLMMQLFQPVQTATTPQLGISGFMRLTELFQNDNVDEMTCLQKWKYCSGGTLFSGEDLDPEDSGF